MFGDFVASLLEESLVRLPPDPTAGEPWPDGDRIEKASAELAHGRSCQHDERLPTS